MISAEFFARAAREKGFGLWSGVPCSYLKPFINYVIDSPDLRYIAAANEGDAVAIAAGSELGGTRGIVMFQNSGLGNAVNPLTSLTYTFRIPVLLIITLRGEPGGAPDAPQHELMGRITTKMLETMEIPWEYFPVGEGQVIPALDRATAHMDEHRRPFAFVMKKGSVESWSLKSRPSASAPGVVTPPAVETPSVSRGDVLRAIQGSAQSGDLVIASTGYGGRELYAVDDRSNQLYMVGSMGCASSLGLGLASARPDRRVIVLDGDGAVIMRMGALATNGYEKPPNLVHIVLDNQVHESTGGQSTVSHSIDLCAIATACGYPRVERARDASDVERFIGSTDGLLSFLHVPILQGTPADLPRPSMTPPEMSDRFRRQIAAPA